MLHKYKPLIFDASRKKKLLHQGTYFYKQKWFYYSIPALCSIALLVGIYMALFPITKLSVNAEEDYGIDTQALATNTLTLAITGTNPDAQTNSSTNVTTGTVAYRQYNFNAKVGNSTGYRIYVQAAEGYTGNLRGLAHPNEQITGVGTDVATNAFPVNTWGYSLTTSTGTANANLKYSTVPENGSNISLAVTSATTDAGTNYKLVFAAKIGDKPADHYQTKVLLSLAARPSTVVRLTDITYMQDMTPDICADSYTEPNAGYTKRLTDIRDSKQYWVAKLRDGNCWMTQNLAYSPYSGIGLSPSNSDVRENVIVNFGVYNKSLDGWIDDASAAKYYNPGLYVTALPDNTTNNCGFAYPGSIAQCTSNVNVGITDVSSLTASEDKNMTAVTSGSTYNAHYLLGNYYSWAAATVGSGNQALGTGDMAVNSICPAGWRLPLGGSNNVGKSGTYGYLASHYGITSGNSLTGTVGGVTYNINHSPLYFVRSGTIRADAVYSVGAAGYLWTNSAANASQAYWVHVSGASTSLTGIGYFPRNTGVPVRCVANW